VSFVSIHKFVDDANDLWDFMLRYPQVVRTVKLDREAAQKYIAHLVQTLPAEQLREYEEHFVLSAGFLISTRQRIRAMELYAWLKLCETRQFKQFCGFSRFSGPLV
jgi:hypothetical protein